MYKGLSISLVIPVFNEETGLKKMLPSAPSFLDEIVIVDGGSTDDTVAIATKYGARVVKQQGRGYGNAYLEGFTAAKSQIITTADGDGTYPLESIEKMLDWLIDRKLDFISGSRFPLSDVNSMHQWNYIGNLVVTTLTSFLFNYKVIDINSGMWLFRKAILKEMQVLSNAWNLSLEIKIEAFTNPKLKFIEYPINYYERLGETKVVRPWRTGLKSLVFLLIKKAQIKKRYRQKQKF
ncbi:glycosyltransferase family 2 protein [Candidatus Berkelbacteria bacterium]|nr:glycosyltransferase family 2 protein [Candidatus Berkelbacteria bacterium]MBI4029762.1 glycosyltransferase family 2 protein [Candidatus Berkelbacteria bacterium]